MLVAAHNGDLKAASGFGQTKDLAPDGARDVVARDFVDLAEKLGC